MSSKLGVSALLTFCLVATALAQKESTAPVQSPPLQSASKQSALDQSAPPVVAAKLGNTRNVHACGNLFLAGQPTKDDIKVLTGKGIRRVITLRSDGEIDWDEERAVTDAGIGFVRIPLTGVETLTDQTLDRIRKLLSDQQTPTLLHCGSANRVGGVWITHRVLDQGVDVETAIREAKEVGFRSSEYEKRVRKYVAERKAKPNDGAKPNEGAEGGSSARSSLNANFLKADLDIDEWLGRFEVESREVYSARDEVTKECLVREGMRIADIGAGTGLYTRQFSDAVGHQGWVYAVDISPRFLQHINEQAEADGRENVTAVLGTSTCIRLPADSIDLAFVCDTYHHFENPAATLASVHRALRRDGMLVVIDFERIPGKSREWLLNHVRADKATFRSEIEAAGFGLDEEVAIDGFEENYFLRFRKR